MAAHISIHKNNLFQFIIFCIGFTATVILMKSIYYNLQKTYPPDPEFVGFNLEDSISESQIKIDGETSKRFTREEDEEGYDYFIGRFRGNVQELDYGADEGNGKNEVGVEEKKVSEESTVNPPESIIEAANDRDEGLVKAEAIVEDVKESIAEMKNDEDLVNPAAFVVEDSKVKEPNTESNIDDDVNKLAAFIKEHLEENKSNAKANDDEDLVEATAFVEEDLEVKEPIAESKKNNEDVMNIAAFIKENLKDKEPIAKVNNDEDTAKPAFTEEDIEVK